MSSAFGASAPNVQTNMAAAIGKSVWCVFTPDPQRASAKRLAHSIAPWPDRLKMMCPGAILNLFTIFSIGSTRFNYMSLLGCSIRDAPYQRSKFSMPLMIDVAAPSP